MFKYLKAFIAASFLWIYTKVMKFMYRNELKEHEAQFKAAMEAYQKKIHDQFKAEAASLNPTEKALADKYASLQNEVFKAFILFTTEIQNAKGSEMDGVAEIWRGTVLGLNATLKSAFQHQNDKKIKEHLDAVNKELQIAIDTNQEILKIKPTSGGNNGGFGYSGPIGEA